MANTIAWMDPTRIIVAVGLISHKINLDDLGIYDFFILFDAVYANLCQHLTDSSGNFSSHSIPRPANEIHSERAIDAAMKTTILISTLTHQQIWLSFKKCVTLEHQHFVNVIFFFQTVAKNPAHLKTFQIYDGPYSTSPLLLSTSGSVKPFSVRSSSNELYLEFPSYYQTHYGITAFYTSVSS